MRENSPLLNPSPKREGQKNDYHLVTPFSPGRRGQGEEVKREEI
jgi:hypothetical protein